MQVYTHSKHKTLVLCPFAVKDNRDAYIGEKQCKECVHNVYTTEMIVQCNRDETVL